MSDDDQPANSPLLADGNDPQDPLRPEIEEENSAPTPPLADPYQDPDATEVQPDVEAADPDADPDAEANDAAPAADSDDESVLSEIDEAQFEDFDPAAIAIEERPVPIDDTNVGLLGKHKRKRLEGEEPEKSKKKKLKKPKRHHIEDDEGFEGGEEIEGSRRARKKKQQQLGGDGTSSQPRQRITGRAATPDDSNLTPAERAKRDLDKKMDEALRNPNRARMRKKDDIDLEAQQDDYLDAIRRRMAEAANADLISRDEGKPAMAKLKMLPEVTSILNRQNLRTSIVDSEGGLLEGVRFFLEPLKDGSLPAYNIQRDIFVALSKLPMNKDALASSGIGKVVMFYTKTKKAEPGIRKAAEKLVGEWMRPILKRSDDFRKKDVVQADYDPSRPIRPTQSTASQTAALIRDARASAPKTSAMAQRARVDGTLPSYTIAPRSNVVPTTMRRAGDDGFKRLKARALAGAGRR